VCFSKIRSQFFIEMSIFKNQGIVIWQSNEKKSYRNGTICTPGVAVCDMLKKLQL
jgi:hypothetical protein